MEMKVTMATVNNPQEWSLNRLKRTSARAQRPSCPGAKFTNSAVMPRDRSCRLCPVQINEVCNWSRHQNACPCRLLPLCPLNPMTNDGEMGGGGSYLSVFVQITYQKIQFTTNGSMALYFGYYARKWLFYCLKKYIFHTLDVQFNSKGVMWCRLKTPQAINNMDDASCRRQCLKKEGKKVKELLLCRPFSFFACRRPVT